MAPESAHLTPPPGTTGWLYGLLVALVVVLWKFKASVTGVAKFIGAVVQVAEMNVRVQELEKNQVTKDDVRDVRIELGQKIDQVENRLQMTLASNHAEQRDSEKAQFEKIDNFITTATMLMSRHRKEDDNA